MEPTWVLSAPGGPHVGPMNFAIWDDILRDHHAIALSSPERIQSDTHTVFSLWGFPCLVVNYRFQCCVWNEIIHLLSRRRVYVFTRSLFYCLFPLRGTLGKHHDIIRTSAYKQCVTAVHTVNGLSHVKYIDYVKNMHFKISLNDGPILNPHIGDYIISTCRLFPRWRHGMTILSALLVPHPNPHTHSHKRQ